MTGEEECFPLIWYAAEVFVGMPAELFEEVSLGTIIKEEGLTKIVVSAPDRGDESVHRLAMAAEIDAVIARACEAFYFAKEVFHPADGASFLECEAGGFH